MNNAKLWLVVKPTVGIPLFLSAVAVGSLAVHVGVISSGVGSWYGPYVTGGDDAEESASLAVPGTVMPASAEAGDLPTYLDVDANGNESLRVILPDGRTATLVVDDLTSAALIE